MRVLAAALVLSLAACDSGSEERARMQREINELKKRDAARASAEEDARRKADADAERRALARKNLVANHGKIDDEVWRDAVRKAGFTICAKCDGVGEVRFGDRGTGVCPDCVGKGFMD